MGLFADVIAYSTWYVMVFFSVVWLMIFLQKRHILRRDPKPTVFPSISIIVPAYNEEDTIESTVRSLEKLDYPNKKLEVIVVNDGSKDRTSQLAHAVAKEFSNVRVVDKPNGGKASALNIGIDHAKGDLIACMDADSVVERDALKRMVGYFKDPQVASVTSSMKVQNRNTILARVQHAEYIMNIFLRKMLTFLDALPVTPGPLSLYRRAVVQRLGGFEGDNLVEDMDMAFKIHEAGYKIENSVRARVWTICPATLRGVYAQRLRWYRGLIGTSLKYRHMFFSRKYGNFGLFFLPLTLASVILVFFLFGLLVSDVLDAVSSLFWSWSLVGFDVAYLLSYIHLPEMNVLAIDTRLALMAGTTILGTTILYLSFKNAGESVRPNAGVFVTYLFLFPVLTMVFWSASILHELCRAKRRW